MKTFLKTAQQEGFSSGEKIKQHELSLFSNPRQDDLTPDQRGEELDKKWQKHPFGANFFCMPLRRSRGLLLLVF